MLAGPRLHPPPCWPRRYPPVDFPVGTGFRAAGPPRSCVWQTTAGAGGPAPVPLPPCPGTGSACSSGNQTPVGSIHRGFPARWTWGNRAPRPLASEPPPASAPVHRSTGNRPARHPGETAPPAPRLDDDGWKRCRANSPACRCRPARQVLASPRRAGRIHGRSPRQRPSVAHASPHPAGWNSRTADWPPGRGIPPAAGTPTSGDRYSRSDCGFPQRRRGALRPPTRTAARGIPIADNPPRAPARHPQTTPNPIPIAAARY